MEGRRRSFVKHIVCASLNTPFALTFLRSYTLFALTLPSLVHSLRSYPQAIEVYTDKSETTVDDATRSEIDGIVDKMFSRCFADGNYGHAFGIALEGRKIEKVEEIICKPTEMVEKVALLVEALEVCKVTVVNRGFRLQVVSVVAREIEGLPAGFEDKERLCEAWQMLGKSDEVGGMVKGLLEEGGERGLLGLQLCFDLVDTGDQKFVGKVVEGVKGGEGDWIRKGLLVLEGGFAGELELAFMFGESDSDPLVMGNLKGVMEEKGQSRSSLLHAMSLHGHGFLNCGTTNDGFLR